MASSNRGIQLGSAWFQRKINLRPQHRGVHLVTEEILRQMPELGQFSVGLCHVQSKYSNAYSHKHIHTPIEPFLNHEDPTKSRFSMPENGSVSIDMLLCRSAYKRDDAHRSRTYWSTPFQRLSLPALYEKKAPTIPVIREQSQIHEELIFPEEKARQKV